MFASVASWSLPSHLYMVSAWSARCSKPYDAMSCVNSTQNARLAARLRAPVGQASAASALCLDGPHIPAAQVPRQLAVLRLSRDAAGLRGRRDDLPGAVPQNAKTPGIWNPLPYFDTVRQDKQRRDIKPISRFYAAARSGNLPAVSWVTPSGAVSEHPPCEHRGRRELRHRPDQHAHERTRLEVERDLPRLGRLGRVLRPCRPAHGRRERLWDARTWSRDQPVCQARVTSTTRFSVSTPTSNSSRTTSSTGIA